MDLLASILARQRLRSTLRRFFDDRGFIEVETPLLIAANAPEPHIDAIPVEFRAAGSRQRRYLRTSPELALKRLLAAGAERIYEIGRAVRDDDSDAAHRVEFTLLEWYRARAPHRTLMDDCDQLLAACADAFELRAPAVGPAGACDLRAPAERLTVAEAFYLYAGVDATPFLGGDAAGLAAAARRAGIVLPGVPARPEAGQFEHVFFAAFLSAVEPHLGLGRPTILDRWPAPLGALARRAPDDARVALRFELYAAGHELANAFDELTDTDEQRRRFTSAQAERAAAGRDPYPLDESFLSELGRMPPACGIALGVERLLMLLTGCPEIGPVALPFGI
ncbi:MAG: EF-P lysine aminoacylase GenX [Deltaproteobacteria bacterium]|nr:EF-P lysine aminoacylase GenX [Deltaproteobacteria bacterium]